VEGICVWWVDGFEGVLKNLGSSVFVFSHGFPTNEQLNEVVIYRRWFHALFAGSVWLLTSFP
jgi:hypothetical protein